MEALKLKIFDVLTEEITISEFENWLYSSEEFMSQIDSNSSYFDLVNINYRKENSRDRLVEITSNVFSKKELLALKLLQNFFKIVNSKTTESYKKCVFNIIDKFDFENDYNFDAFWRFYDIYYSFDGYDYCEYENINLEKIDSESKKFAISVVEKFKKAKSIEEKVLSLKQEKEDSTAGKTVSISSYKELENKKKIKKQTLKQKFLAFFKKI